MTASSLDRSVGALLGLACGDAVGTTLEFRRPGSFEPIDDMVGGGPFQLEPGEWTDDTSLALCLAESILDRGGHDPTDQLRRYVLWQTKGYLSSNGTCFDIGATTSSQLARYRRTGEPYDPDPDENAAANDSLMRLASVPIRWHADTAVAAERAADSSRTTHPSRRAIDTCRVLGAMTSALIAGVDADVVFDNSFWTFGELHAEVEAVVRGSWRNKQPPAIRGTGFCIDALEAALWAVDGADDFHDAILRAANLGDDADTTAAIAGQLAGARWGATGIPSHWRTTAVANERITSLATNLHRIGSDDAPDRWPFDDFVHAWWVEPGAIIAGEYPGDTNPLRARDKVNTLVDAGIRSFIDLTTPDDGLAPYAHFVADAATNRNLDLRHHRFPIPDLGVIATEGYDRIVACILDEQERGGVFVHCWGGVGRTGTVVGCLLAQPGAGFDDVMQSLAAMRAGTRKANRPCPETSAQRAVIRDRTH